MNVICNQIKTNKLIKDYFSILSPDYLDWLDEYIETERMLKHCIDFLNSDYMNQESTDLNIRYQMI